MARKRPWSMIGGLELDNPGTYQHGHPIPGGDGAIVEAPSTSLVDCRASDRVRIVKVFEDDPEMLKYLATLGLLPNVDLKIEEVGPFNGPLLINVPNGSSRDTYLIIFLVNN